MVDFQTVSVVRPVSGPACHMTRWTPLPSPRHSSSWHRAHGTACGDRVEPVPVMDQHHRPLLNGWRQSNTGRRTWRRGALPLSAARREGMADTPPRGSGDGPYIQYRALARSTKTPNGRGSASLGLYLAFVLTENPAWAGVSRTRRQLYGWPCRKPRAAGGQPLLSRPRSLCSERETPQDGGTPASTRHDSRWRWATPYGRGQTQRPATWSTTQTEGPGQTGGSRQPTMSSDKGEGDPARLGKRNLQVEPQHNPNGKGQRPDEFPLVPQATSRTQDPDPGPWAHRPGPEPGQTGTPDSFRGFSCRKRGKPRRRRFRTISGAR